MPSGWQSYVIDDDEAMRESLAFLPSAVGLRCGPANPPWHPRRASKVGAGCVITDVRMPEPSGVDLLRRCGNSAWHSGDAITGRGDVPLAGSDEVRRAGFSKTL
jgi:two-component system response regulator FixJ